MATGIGAYLSPQQQTFVENAAKASGLDPTVIAAHLRNEEPLGPTNTDPAGHGAYNFLNIGITGSGNYGANAPYWKDPAAAGRATGLWMTGKLSVPGFGTASSGIQNAVKSTVGKSPQEQINAIQTSGWAGGHEGVRTENDMPQLYNDISKAGGLGTAAGLTAAYTGARTAVHAATQAAVTSPALPALSTAPTADDTARANFLQYTMAQNAGGAAKAAAPPLATLLSAAITAHNTSTPQTVTTLTAPTGKKIPVQVDPGVVPDHSTAGAIKIAEKYLGTAYHFGGASPKTGFDCSGLLQYSYAQMGIHIPRVTSDQIKAGTPVASTKDLKPGDAIFFNGGEHVGMYIGNGNFIQAPHTGDVVKISKLAGYDGGPFAMRRYA